MEYDNDRIIKPAYKIEIFYWVLLILISPFANGITVFLSDWKIWLVLLFVSLAAFPAYLLYSRLMGAFLLQKRYIFFVLGSLFFFLIIQTFLFAIYSIILKFSLPSAAQSYFSYNYDTIIRESLWVIINMSLAIAVFFIKQALDEKEELLNMQRDNTLFRLRYLRAQLNPHFLFNTLNSIYSLSLQKSDKTPEVVIKLADIMRYLVEDCNEPKIPLNKEIEFIQNYLEIEKIRHKADIRFTVEGQTDGVTIEPFLFISFIENGFKHALDNSYDNSFIYIKLRSDPGQITLTVVNNTAIDIETQSKKIQGTGIKNSKNLLELLYPGDYALNIIQTDTGERRKSLIRFKNARERLKSLYPDSHTLDVILSNNAFTVSLIIKSGLA
ncbi:MAG: histidine kinase [Chitinophagaceae bacterium]|nr:histidine kinase [Chitinophagaceae bacterium]